MDSLTSTLSPQTTPHTTTRPATSQDDPFLLELYKTMRAWEMAQVDWSESEKDTFLQQQFNAQQTHYLQAFPNATHDIILQNGQPIGRIYVDHNPTEIRLLDIVLLPEKRNQGIGAAYLQTLQQAAGQANIPLRFYVWQLNHAAQRFYQRHGCRVVEEVGAYILMEWRPLQST
ncbi:MAG: GNAT family N-acetyltransferase [Chloroflexota bacterium]